MKTCPWLSGRELIPCQVEGCIYWRTVRTNALQGQLELAVPPVVEEREYRAPGSAVPAPTPAPTDPDGACVLATVQQIMVPVPVQGGGLIR